MKTGDKVSKDCIMMVKTETGFGETLVFGCGTILPSYGMSNNGVVEWQERNYRAGILENARQDGTFKSTITADGTLQCPQSGEWKILGTEIREILTQGSKFPKEYKNYIWVMV
jgi:hypothetical protein